MTPTFETVLDYAKSLSPAERDRLIKTLARLSESGDSVPSDDKVLADLKAKVDQHEASPDPFLTESEEIASGIRESNDRGFSL